MSLDVYQRKRNFKITPEPKEGPGDIKDALSFVVQRHSSSHLHYDFRLELEGVLKSWAVPKGPSMIAGEKRLAVMVEDHPLSYGKFFGEIPKGNYGAGMVDIWDEGIYWPIQPVPRVEAEKIFLAQLAKGDIKFTLHGHHLQGSFALVKMNDDSGKNWLLIKKKDDFDVLDFNIKKTDPFVSGDTTHKKWEPNADAPTSEKVSRKGEIETDINKAWKTACHPMLARLADKVINKGGWIYEIKFDGYRTMAKVNCGVVNLVSRNGNSFNALFKALVKELETVKADVILDGEVVIEDEKGISSFQLLQNFSTTKMGTLKYYLFDILYLNGFQLSHLTLRQRKELLGLFFKNNHFKHIYNSEFIEEQGAQLYTNALEKGHEGIIAKDLDGTYHFGKRSETWVKVKSTLKQEAVIAGYTHPRNSRKHFGSLLLGTWAEGKLVYIGNCGSGFTQASLAEVHKKIENLETSEMPFEEKPIMRGMKEKPTWVKPTLVCNVKFQEWTKDRHMRIPVFLGLRADKTSEEGVGEKAEKSLSGEKAIGQKEKVISIDNQEVKCANLTKIYWPDDGITKGQMIEYYKGVSEWILPYLKNRPLSLNRHPNGITGKSFYQKDMDVTKIPGWLQTEKMYSKTNDAKIDYLICNNEASLIYMANLGCIEINPWHSVYSKPEFPDFMILDLDPGEINFNAVVDTAHVIKDLCVELEIECYCKTSGATGLHIYIPLHAQYTYTQVQLFGELMATITQQRLPGITSIERSVSKRKDKVYIDYLQNRQGQTIAAPYSIRPKPHATVSCPLNWTEVNPTLNPINFHIFNMLQRLEKVGDLWKDVLGKGIDLSRVVKKLESI